MEHDKRPWGQYWVLEDSKSYKVKRVEVHPNHRLSYQYHHKRSEIWTIVQGVGQVTINGEVKEYGVGEVVKIPQGAKHRIANPKEDENCVFIEVQVGTYFGEDDIVRIQDDYSRE
ncbi:phosphomannose isomerase type II C-terminal cupin domain [Mesonia maritima]|uniref:Mannose-6-phosphate isomerase n=1 Tax=Mesonia maritima TaxID=1793873 RepID=A0ABU1K894_9FLAO|nr:phosphomannose isomerase type II C-terminal cupin domain [Mesonia maritima]MDR6301829.1 mannose-6-phosphate isomerase [Mesonia maritima]